MSQTNNRMQRIGDQIQQALAQLLILKIHDPRLRNISITAVDVSPDMANATVFVSTLEQEHIKEILKALEKASGFFRRELAHSLNLRITPRLRFTYDKSLANADHLNRLLDAVIHPPEKPPENE